MTVDGPPMRLRPAADDDRDWIHELRHRVYAEELGQHPTNTARHLRDNLDDDNVYLVAAHGDTRVGFVSITAPWLGRYAIDKYLTRDAHPMLGDDALFEVRILTVEPRWRGSAAAPLLMYAALRWISSRGGRRVVALGRTELLRMYLDAGLQPAGPDGAVRPGHLRPDGRHGRGADPAHAAPSRPGAAPARRPGRLAPGHRAVARPGRLRARRQLVRRDRPGPAYPRPRPRGGRRGCARRLVPAGSRRRRRAWAPT